MSITDNQRPKCPECSRSLMVKNMGTTTFAIPPAGSKGLLQVWWDGSSCYVCTCGAQDVQFKAQWIDMVENESDQDLWVEFMKWPRGRDE